MILSPRERTANELDIIYEELVNIKALSNFSSLVKKELATYLLFEAHHFSDTVIFRQGDEGDSWYIILKGSVNVSINGKGVVTTLSEGEEFGKLSLVNNCPRSATITTRVNNCHFLRVVKSDFDQIVKDCVANNVYLKELDKIVLVLQKLPFNTKNEISRGCYKYSVISGTPEKLLEHLLETRILFKTDDTSDTFIEDFLMTHIIFLPDLQLCAILISYYNMFDMIQVSTRETSISNKKKVVRFIKEWCDIAKDAFYEDTIIVQLINDIFGFLKMDAKIEARLREDLKIIEMIIDSNPYLNVKKLVKVLWRNGSRDVAENIRKPIRPQDENIFKGMYFLNE